MMRPLSLSVVTICRNAAPTIRRTIDSVLSQNIAGLEYIVVDGGSTDGTVEVLQSYGPAITHWISEADQGISDAFNKGIALCHAPWIGSVNADDWYETGALAHVLEAAGDAEVFCGRMRYWEGDKPGVVFGVNPPRLPYEMSVNHQATFARKSVYERLGGFKLHYKYAMDYELFLRFYQGGARFATTDRVLAHMAWRGVSHRQWRGSLAESRRAKIDNGIPSARAWTEWFFIFAKNRARAALEALGARGLVAELRRRFGSIKKADR